MIRPLPLRLHTQMGAGLLEGDLDLPAQDEPADDLQGIPRGIGAQQGLRREASEGIAQQHPADWHDRLSAMAPHGRCRAELDQPIPFAIPARHRNAAPARACPRQHIRKGRQASSFGARTAACPWPARWGRLIEGSIQPKPRDADHTAAGQGRQQFQGGKAHVSHQHQLALGQPTPHLQHHLAGPVGQLLMPLSALTAVALGGRQGGEERQGPGAGGPRDGRQEHETDPAQA